MTKSINVLVIGYGSIGQRHTNVLNKLGHKVSVVSRRKIDYEKSYKDINMALEKENPEYIVMANETSAHEYTLTQLKEFNYKRKILIEKPLFHEPSKESFNFNELYVGYNLRFHPIIQTLFEKLKGKKVISVQTYVGQYLPSWRPNTDYSESYSSKINMGGGVIRDLSHELDYLQLLFGQWESLVAYGGKFSELNIDSDDTFALMYKTDKCPLISLQVNYLDYIFHRTIIINTSDTTFKADLINNTLQINDETFSYNVDRDDTYMKQHMAIINDEKNLLCTFHEGNNIVKMIEAAETSSRERVWLENE